MKSVENLNTNNIVTILNTLEEDHRYVPTTNFVLDQVTGHIWYSGSFGSSDFVWYALAEIYNYMKEGGMIDEEEET